MNSAEYQDCAIRLLAKIKVHADEFRAFWTAEHDGFYRFYHHSFKVFHLQFATEKIVAALRSLNPRPERSLHPWFEEIVAAGTGKHFVSGSGVGGGHETPELREWSAVEDHTGAMLFRDEDSAALFSRTSGKRLFRVRELPAYDRPTNSFWPEATGPVVTAYLHAREFCQCVGVVADILDDPMENPISYPWATVLELFCMR